MPAPRHLFRARAALLTASLLVLGACGGGEDTVTTEPAPPTTTTAPDRTAPDAVAPGTPGGAGPGGETRLTVSLDETGQGAVRTMELTCDPPGGDHPDPQAACAALREAGGLAAFQSPPEDMACTEIYGGPQTATVTGTVAGAAVTMTFSRINGCEIAAWDALAPLLGTPGGEV